MQVLDEKIDSDVQRLLFASDIYKYSLHRMDGTGTDPAAPLELKYEPDLSRYR